MNKKITLLYAEDEVETRQNHIDYLKDRYDFNYLEASDGVEALALYKAHNPEIILTDITMPNMDGLTFVQHVREHSPYTKIVILTAYDEREKLMKAFDLDV
ncbi:MAG: response regulator, partial [Helicobacteraceae bacterium]|nr:response regulator [Helicobacteraceae bacterium]